MLKVGWVHQLMKLSVKFQPVGGKRILQIGQELAAKEEAERLYRQEERRFPERHPVLPVCG